MTTVSLVGVLHDLTLLPHVPVNRPPVMVQDTPGSGQNHFRTLMPLLLFRISIGAQSIAAPALAALVLADVSETIAGTRTHMASPVLLGSPRRPNPP
jgi:hypothetical protein